MRRTSSFGSAMIAPADFILRTHPVRLCRACAGKPENHLFAPTSSAAQALSAVKCLLMSRDRIDKVLVERGLAVSRTKAQAMVMAGAVLVNEQRVDKPSELVAPEAQIRIKGSDDPAIRYVGRGGLKLEAALREFAIDVDDRRCLDVGASTGGFTDCLLQHGARQVVAVDVGHNQIDWRLRNDARVEVREGINARYLRPEDFADQFDLAVMDVSFISATKVMPAIVLLLRPFGRSDRAHQTAVRSWARRSWQRRHRARTRKTRARDCGSQRSGA